PGGDRRGAGTAQRSGGGSARGIESHARRRERSEEARPALVERRRERRGDPRDSGTDAAQDPVAEGKRGPGAPPPPAPLLDPRCCSRGSESSHGKRARGASRPGDDCTRARAVARGRPGSPGRGRPATPPGAPESRRSSPTVTPRRAWLLQGPERVVQVGDGWRRPEPPGPGT